MTYDEQQRKRVANYIAGFAHILGGKPERFNEFRRKVDIMLGGPAAHLFGLMQFADQVRATGRPLLWIHQSVESPQVPQIGIVTEIAGQMRFIENSLLWLGADENRAMLVPDSFLVGGYQFDADFRLHHIAEAPASSFEAAKDGMVRACDRLAMIQLEQWDRGDVFDLPQHARAA